MIFVIYKDTAYPKDVGMINRVQIKFNTETEEYGLFIWRDGYPLDMEDELTVDEIKAVIECHQRLNAHLAKT